MREDFVLLSWGSACYERKAPKGGFSARKDTTKCTAHSRDSSWQKSKILQRIKQGCEPPKCDSSLCIFRKHPVTNLSLL